MSSTVTTVSTVSPGEPAASSQSTATPQGSQPPGSASASNTPKPEAKSASTNKGLSVEGASPSGDATQLSGLAGALLSATPPLNTASLPAGAHPAGSPPGGSASRPPAAGNASSASQALPIANIRGADGTAIAASYTATGGVVDPNTKKQSVEFQINLDGQGKYNVYLDQGTDGNSYNQATEAASIASALARDPASVYARTSRNISVVPAGDPKLNNPGGESGFDPATKGIFLNADALRSATPASANGVRRNLEYAAGISQYDALGGNIQYVRSADGKPLFQNANDFAGMFVKTMQLRDQYAQGHTPQNGKQAEMLGQDPNQLRDWFTANSSKGSSLGALYDPKNPEDPARAKTMDQVLFISQVAGGKMPMGVAAGTLSSRITGEFPPQSGQKVPGSSDSTIEVNGDTIPFTETTGKDGSMEYRLNFGGSTGVYNVYFDKNTVNANTNLSQVMNIANSIASNPPATFGFTSHNFFVVNDVNQSLAGQPGTASNRLEAAYDSNSGDIFVRAQTLTDSLRANTALVHEGARAVDQHFGNASDSVFDANGNQLFGYVPGRGSSSYASEDAKTSSREDFAETYASAMNLNSVYGKENGGESLVDLARRNPTAATSWIENNMGITDPTSVNKLMFALGLSSAQSNIPAAAGAAPQTNPPLPDISATVPDQSTVTLNDSPQKKLQPLPEGLKQLFSPEEASSFQWGLNKQPYDKQNYADPLTDFEQGFVDGAVGTATSLINMVAHPLSTAEGIANSALHPVDTFNALKNSLMSAYQKNPAKFFGELTFNVASIPVGGALGDALKGVHDAGDAGVAAEAAGLAGKPETLAQGVTRQTLDDGSSEIAYQSGATIRQSPDGNVTITTGGKTYGYDLGDGATVITDANGATTITVPKGLNPYELHSITYDPNGAITETYADGLLRVRNPDGSIFGVRVVRSQGGSVDNLLRKVNQEAAGSAVGGRGLSADTYQEWITQLLEGATSKTPAGDPIKIPGNVTNTGGSSEFDVLLQNGNENWLLETKAAKGYNYFDKKEFNVEEFKYQVSKAQKNAEMLGYDYGFITNSPIPDSIQAWLRKKGIPFWIVR